MKIIYFLSIISPINQRIVSLVIVCNIVCNIFIVFAYKMACNKYLSAEKRRIFPSELLSHKSLTWHEKKILKTSTSTSNSYSTSTALHSSSGSNKLKALQEVLRPLRAVMSDYNCHSFTGNEWLEPNVSVWNVTHRQHSWPVMSPGMSPWVPRTWSGCVRINSWLSYHSGGGMTEQTRQRAQTGLQRKEQVEESALWFSRSHLKQYARFFFIT